MNIAEDLDCPICFDLFHDPVTLKCGHSFCRKHIEHIYNVFCLEHNDPSEGGSFDLKGLEEHILQAGGSTSQVKPQEPKLRAMLRLNKKKKKKKGLREPKTKPSCPLCKTTFVDDVDLQKGMLSLKTNYKLTELCNRFQEGMTPNCDNCEEHLAECECLNCPATLCNKCFKEMHKPKFFRSHRKGELGQLKEKSKAQKIRKCQEHPEEDVKAFCTEDGELVCLICSQFGHHCGHKCVTLDKGIQLIKGEIETLIRSLSESKENDILTVERIETENEKYESEMKNVLQKVKDEFTHLESQIKLMKKEFLERITSHMSLINGNLKTIKDIVIEEKRLESDFLNLKQKRNENTNALQFVELKKKAEQTVNMFKKINSNFKVQATEFDVDIQKAVKGIFDSIDYKQGKVHLKGGGDDKEAGKEELMEVMESDSD